MSKSLVLYTHEVNENIEELTHGVFDLGSLVDFADGENSISEMFAAEVDARDAARRVMAANGYIGALNCWSTDCDECSLEDECPHIN